MPKVNIYLPDDLAEAVKDAGVPVSAICQRALEYAVRRVTAIREIAAGVPDAFGTSDPPVVNLTRRAMKVLRSAQAAAQADDSAEMHTEHLLGALVAEDNMAVRVLTALEITPQQVSSALAGREQGRAGSAASRRSDGDAIAAIEAGVSPQAATALELATTESSGLGNSYVGCEHLLLGLIGEPDGVAGSVLRSLGADLRVTRRTVAAALAGWSAGFVAHEQQAAGQGAVQAPGGQAAQLAEQVAGYQSADQLSAAIRKELGPVLARIERLEKAAGAGSPG
jgi:ATP-dependent Clp protease ATP-binding subunit ClpA